MTRTFKAISLSVSLCAIATFALGTSKQAQSQTTSKGPVAYVYVSSSPTASYNQVEGFSAAADGQLTRISGSPFNADVTSMAVNGKSLFGSTKNGIYVDTYTIESDGALHLTTSTNVVKSNTDDCGVSGPLFLDHSGNTLYDMEANGDCANNFNISFAVENHGKSLKNLGGANGGEWLVNPATFIGNDVYAYSASCLYDMYWEIFGFKRSSDGMLSQISIKSALPTHKQNDFYCPSLAAADPTNHVAITMQAVDNQQFTPDGAPQLASYTADSAGNLITSSTRANMPTTAVVNVTDLKMAPSGKLLAVAGTGGLQIFHFNGASPITAYTGLLTKDEIDQCFWDNNNHLYAISHASGKLFVFTVTPTSNKQAAGSPYSISAPQDLAVQPK
jgi:hypothetical protein